MADPGLYVVIAAYAMYPFGSASLETGEATALVPLVLLVAFLVAQWTVVLSGRSSARR